MAINTAIIQHRRGSLDDFNPEKLTPGELAVITDERSVYMGFPGGEAEKIVLEKDFTSESIKEKLGYEPADEERVDQLFRDKADYQYVDKKVSNVKVDLTGYAKEDYVDDEIEELNKKIVQETGKLSKEIVGVNTSLSNKISSEVLRSTNEDNTLKQRADSLEEQVNKLNAGGLIMKEDFIGQQVNEWLDEHPEATTTVQDESLTIDKMVVGTLGYVTPEMFGAVGDGQTDDTDCLQKCFDEKKDVYLENKTYLVSKKLYIYENTHIHGNGAIIKASGDLLTVENNKTISIVHIKGNNVTIDDLAIDGSLTYFNRVDLTNDEFIEEYNRYYEAKKYGSKGIFADSCKNLKIRNVLIHHTTYGFNFYFCTNLFMERCVTKNTLIDSFGLYSGIKNATIINCASYDSGDDAFTVYSAKLSVDNEGLNYQSENIKFINCYSENCHARAFLNHGGLNVVFDSCVSKNARQFCAVLGEEFYPSIYYGHKVDNTTFINCFADVNKLRGFDTFNGIHLYDFGKLCFINCIIDSSLFEEADIDAMLSIQKRGNLTFNGCDIRHFRLNTGYDVTDNNLLLKIKDCKFHGAKDNHLLRLCVFEITDSYFRGSGRYIFDVSGSYGIKFNNCDFDITKLIAGNVNTECHVECDNINIVHSGTVLSQSGRITLKGVQVVETMLQNRLKFDDKSCVIYNKTIKTYNATNAEWE